MIRVLLADDQALLRAGFRALLESAADIEVVGEAANGGIAVALAAELLPDIILMDLKMPEVDGITAIGRIAADQRLAGVTGVGGAASRCPCRVRSTPPGVPRGE